MPCKEKIVHITKNDKLHIAKTKDNFVKVVSIFETIGKLIGKIFTGYSFSDSDLFCFNF